MGKRIIIDLTDNICLGDIPNLGVEWVCACGHENVTPSAYEVFECTACGRYFSVTLEARIILTEMAQNDIKFQAGEKKNG